MAPHVMQQRLDALVRQQHVPKPLLDLLSLLVANALDTDDFKQNASARVAVVEGLVRQPTSEIAAARAETVAALDSMQCNVEALERKFRATYEALKAEADLRLAHVREASERAAEEADAFRLESRDVFAESMKAYRRQVEETFDVEVAHATNRLREAQESVEVLTQRKLAALEVSCIEDAGTSLANLASDARLAAEEATREAKSKIDAKLASADVEISSRLTAASGQVARALESLNALPLLECHRLECTLALVESRVDVIEATTAKSTVDQLQHRLHAVEASVARVAMRNQQLDDRIELVGAGIPATGSSPRATDRFEAVRALSDEFLLHSPSSSRHAFGSADLARSPRRDVGAMPTQRANAGGGAGPTMHHLLRLQTRLDELESSTLQTRQAGQQALLMVRKLGELIDLQIVSRLEAIGESQSSLFHCLAVPQPEALTLFRAHKGELDALEDASLEAKARGRGSNRIGPDVELKHATLRHQIDTSRLVLATPAFASLTPLPTLGVELADGAQPLGGVNVIATAREGIAAVCGLLADDVILRVDRYPVMNREEFHFALQLAAAVSLRSAISPSPTRYSRRCTVALAVFRPTVGTVLTLNLSL
jgi:hypothetical protein